MDKEIINTDDYFYEITDESRGTIGYGCISYKTTELIGRIHKQNKQFQRLQQGNTELKAENERLKKEIKLFQNAHDTEQDRKRKFENCLDEIKEIADEMYEDYRKRWDDNISEGLEQILDLIYKARKNNEI